MKIPEHPSLVIPEPIGVITSDYADSCLDLYLYAAERAAESNTDEMIWLWDNILSKLEGKTAYYIALALGSVLYCGCPNSA